MKKSTRIVKRLLALFLIVLMSINTFGAVVSDNDGSAFITKAEFDSMKNDFQSQIDQYNTSIDSKIDGAIAAYLSGISLAKKIELPILLNEYNQIRWVPDWKVYGKYKEWTGWDLFQEYDISWFRPHFNDRRLVIWNDQVRLTDITSFQYGAVATTALGTITAYRGCTRGTGGNPGREGIPQAPPVFAVKLNLVDDKWILDPTTTLLCGLWSCPMIVLSTQNKAYNTITGEVDKYELGRNSFGTLDGGTWLTMSAVPDAIWSYDAVCGTAADPDRWTLHNVVTSDIAEFPLSLGMIDISSDRGYQATSEIGIQSADQVDIGSVIDAGVHWDRLHMSSRVAHDAFYYMMLGRDNDQVVNLFKNYDETSSTFLKINVDDSVGMASVDVKIDKVAMNPLNLYANRGPQPDAVDKDLTLNIPLLPQAALSQLTNGLWEYQNQPLKIGQGLPLVNDAFSSGYLQVSFDYDVKSILDNTSKNKKIQLDIKENDYLQSSGGYKSGYKGKDDPFLNAKSVETIHNFNYEDTNGHLDLTCEVTKGDSIWLRLSPSDDSGGLYAIISNLKCYLLTS